MLASPTSKKRPSSKDEEKDLWSTLLDSVSSGKRLPEKNVIVIGGSPETQKDFLETLDSEAAKRPQERTRRKAPVANEFALGFTYQDVLDADHEDTLARLSIYTLPEPPDAFMPLMKPLLTAKSIPESVLVLLLDWAEPWKWVRQIRDRLRLIQTTLAQIEDDDAKQVIEETMQDWQQRRRGPVFDGSTQAPNEPNVNVPLGPGEWDEALGLPLCVVCHGVEKMDQLEKDQSWREEDFDYVLQFLRTIILKHGGSLIYTAGTSPNSLPTLVQSTLGIQSLLKRNPLKHNVVDREKILIPPNWDSWGKIKVIREGFNVEGISDGWSLEVQPLRSPQLNGTNGINGETKGETAETSLRPPTQVYAENVLDPQADQDVIDLDDADDDTLETQTPSMQEFLAEQYPVIEKLKQEDEAAANADPRAAVPEGASYAEDDGRVNQHIGPVQFNMGGIQVDAEDALQRLRKGREDGTPEPESAMARSPAPTSGIQTPDEGVSNDHLKSFFANLVKKGAHGGAGAPPAS